MRAVHDTRCDGVDVDAVFDQVQTRRLRHGNDGGLGRAINQHKAFATPPGLTCHIDDFAAVALRDHLACSSLHREQGARDVDRIKPIIAFAGDVDGFSRIKQRRVVDQDIELSSRVDNGGNRRVNRGLIGNIQFNRIGGIANLGGRLARRRKVDVAYRYARALARVRPRPPRAPRTRAGRARRGPTASAAPFARRARGAERAGR